jgi:HlyD family secretion protein
LLWQRQRAGAVRDLEPYTVQARSGTLPGVVTATGELDAVRRVNVSPKRQGQLEQLYVDEGDLVRRGQPIARMDSTDLQDRLAELQAAVRSAEAEMERSRSELERNAPLYQQNAISLNDYNRFRSDFEVKRMNVVAARERLQARQVEADDLIVRAPFDGRIIQRYAQPGAFVTPTTTASATAGATSSSIVELASGLEAIARVPEGDVGRLRLGMPADIRVDAYPDRRFPARVRQIAPRAIKLNNVTSFEVKLSLVRPAPELAIGMTADIDFKTGSLRADTLVPSVAIVTENGKPGVLVVGKDQQPTFRPVELGASSGRNTQILSGLQAGTPIFIDLPPWAKKKESR